MEELNIRLATEADLAAIGEIYDHYVLHCTCTWRMKPQTPQERAAWFLQHDAAHPLIVAQSEGRVVGWGSLSEFRSFDGYRHTVENSVYVRDGAHGRGIGSAILGDLVRRGRDAGHHCIIAVISADQAPSIALHAKFGFVEMGRLREVGRKFDHWMDVVFMERLLQETA
jgi:phosphinothricin acetyltransferase